MEIDKRKVCILTGVSGMDGSILAEKLIKKGYFVIGVDKWNPTGVNPNLKNVFKEKNFILETGDITEKTFMENLIKKYEPDYFYNLAAISLVSESFKIPQKFFEINTMAHLNILEIIRYHSPKTRLYFAASSEMIGKNTEENQNLESKMIPNSPYAITKLASYHLTRLYRESYGLYCISGMLFNHEHARRGPVFVTRKISLGVANIHLEKQDKITLGNLNAYRDWGNADDYTDAMIMMLEADEPEDYTVATGDTHSVRDFVEEAFKAIDKKITWVGEGLDEKGYDQDEILRVEVDEKYYRPAEVTKLHGDCTKIKENLGWFPKTNFSKLVKIMVESDIDIIANNMGNIISVEGGLSK